MVKKSYSKANSLDKNSSIKSKLCLYGLGSIGDYLLDILKKKGFEVEFVIDRKLAGSNRNGIPILSLEDAKKRSLNEFSFLERFLLN